MHVGKEALARVINRLATEPDSDIDAVWPDFATAVQAAMAEAKEREAEGLQKWREARHAKGK